MYSASADNSRIIVAADGSRVQYDKDNPRTENSIIKISENADMKRKPMNHLR